MSAKSYSYKVPELTSDVLTLTIHEPEACESGQDYYCLVQVAPLDDEPFKIYGVDAAQAAYLARHLFAQTYSKMTVTDLNDQELDRSIFYSL